MQQTRCSSGGLNDTENAGFRPDTALGPPGTAMIFLHLQGLLTRGSKSCQPHRGSHSVASGTCGSCASASEI